MVWLSPFSSWTISRRFTCWKIKTMSASRLTKWSTSHITTNCRKSTNWETVTGHTFMWPSALWLSMARSTTWTAICKLKWLSHSTTLVRRKRGPFSTMMMTTRTMMTTMPTMLKTRMEQVKTGLFKTCSPCPWQQTSLECARKTIVNSASWSNQHLLQESWTLWASSSFMRSIRCSSFQTTTSWWNLEEANRWHCSRTAVLYLRWPECRSTWISTLSSLASLKSSEAKRQCCSRNSTETIWRSQDLWHSNLTL